MCKVIAIANQKGLLSVITILSSIVLPLPAYAAEVQAYEEKYPVLEKVRNMLDEDEVVVAIDYEVEVGSNFDVKIDFSGLDINTEKVKVAFEEAKSSSGQNFDINHKEFLQCGLSGGTGQWASIPSC